MIRDLETPRLLLRTLRLEDAEPTQKLFPHWEIVRYLAALFRGHTPPTERLLVSGTLLYRQSPGETNGIGVCA